MVTVVLEELGLIVTLAGSVESIMNINCCSGSKMASSTIVKVAQISSCSNDVLGKVITVFSRV